MPAASRWRFGSKTKRGWASKARSPAFGPNAGDPGQKGPTRHPLRVSLHLWRCLPRARRDRRAGHVTRQHRSPSRQIALQSPAGQWMNAHLLEISRTVAPGTHAIIVLDGAGWHGSNALELPDNISLLSLPPYAPELNPVENIWAYLRANKLAISVFETYDQIVDACCEAWNFLAKDPGTIRSIATRDYAKPVNS